MKKSGKKAGPATKVSEVPHHHRGSPMAQAIGNWIAEELFGYDMARAEVLIDGDMVTLIAHDKSGGAWVRTLHEDEVRDVAERNERKPASDHEEAGRDSWLPPGFSVPTAPAKPGG
jgi:hypothetical protein